MEAVSKFEKLKMDIILASLLTNNNLIRMIGLQFYCPWLLNDKKTHVSYGKLINIHNTNMECISDIVNYINSMSIDVSNIDITKLCEEFSYIDSNIKLQFKFYVNLLKYINARNHFNYLSMNNSFIDEEFVSNDDSIFNSVQQNTAKIKKLEKERRDNLE